MVSRLVFGSQKRGWDVLWKKTSDDPILNKGELICSLQVPQNDFLPQRETKSHPAVVLSAVA